MGNVASKEYWGRQIPQEHEYGKDRRLTIRSVKMFTDGKHTHLPLHVRLSELVSRCTWILGRRAPRAVLGPTRLCGHYANL
jgi:hypothetical protein